MVLLVIAGLTSFGQENLTIKGEVKDENGQPVEQVIVSVLDEFIQVATDSRGTFSMVIEPGKTLLFSKMGYQQQTLKPERDNSLSVVLVKESVEPVYQVAYGSRTRSELTMAISTISASDLEKAPVSTLGNAIQGLSSGLSVIRTIGAEPGWDQPAIFIRGIQTFGNGYTPLVMVDNVERDFTQLDPEEIESFTVLKDAAATAMYGMRGANGVILVTTKKGYVGKPVITLKASYGMQSPTRLPRYVSASEYIKYHNMALRNDYNKLSDDEFNALFLTDPANQPESYNGSNPDLYPDTDWYAAFLKQMAPQQSYKLSFRGGNETAQYYIMLGLIDQEGLYQYTDENPGYSTQNVFSRYNFRSTVDVKLTDDLKVGVNLGGRVENRHVPNSSAGSIISAISRNPASMPVLNPDGSIAGTAIYTNPYGLIAKTGFQDQFNRYLQGTTTLDWKLDKLLKGLTANALFGFDVYKSYGRSKNQSFARYQLNADGSYTQYGENTSLDLNYSGWGNDFGLMLNYQFGFAYDRTFGETHLAADLKYMQSSQTVVGDNPDYRNQGIFGRVTWSLAKKYTAEFGFAYNGCEDFAPEKRFGFFPTLSAGWLISNEEFLKDNSVISLLKLRGSVGISGNSNIGIGRFPFEEKFYDGGGYYFGTANTDGSYEGRIPNANITWEEARCANLGLEAGLLDKLMIEADFFRHNRKQIITGRWNTLPSFIGQDLPYENKGAVLSQGVELNADYHDKTGDFSYMIKGTISYANNKVTEKDEVNGLNSWEYRAGRSVSQQWGLQVSDEPFFNSQSEIDNWAKSSYGTVQPGDIKYVDQNGDLIIDEQDYIPLGNPVIPEWNFGCTLGCAYHGIDINVLLTGVAQRSIFISNNVLFGLANNNNITRHVAENSWGVSTDPIYPRLTTQANTHNYQSASIWQKNGGFFRVQTLELGYNLPGEWLQRINVTALRIFVNGYNLISFDHFKALNLSAEIPNAGVTMYPEIKVINLGVSLKL